MLYTNGTKPSADNELTRIIRAEIAGTGPISCARFMELALYHPVHGYYERQLKQIGCQGDFYTSVSVGNLLGQLLAFEFSTWLDRISSSDGVLQLVEAGAHTGHLARDILHWFSRQRPDLSRRLQYWIIEPSPARRAAQRELLADWNAHLHWVDGWRDLPPGGVRGIVFSNELLDAFPVYRLGWDAHRRAWFEWRVRDTSGRLAWTRSLANISPEVTVELNADFWRTIPEDLLQILPDGFTVEICPAAVRWWSHAAATLREGKLLTLDYGLDTEEFFVPHRSEGTLRSYYRHRPSRDPLANPGDQDLTAHVNFSNLKRAGEEAGLETEWLGSQGRFLTRLATTALARPLQFGPWTSSCVRQFHTLTHPDFLGRPFRVLLQRRASAAFDR